MSIPASIKSAITRFDTAAQQMAFQGAADPDDRVAIVHQYQTARINLERAIERAIK